MEVVDLNPQNTYDYGNNIDTSDLCADISYCLILPFSFQDAKLHQNFGTKPYLVTYTDENTPFTTIINEYKEMNFQVKNKKIRLTLKQGFPISENITIREFILEMGGANINGINLFTEQLNKVQAQPVVYGDEDEDDQSDLEYIDQSAISKYLAGQEGFGSTDIRLLLQIPLKNRIPEVLTFCVHGDTNYHEFLDMIINKIKLEFGKTLTQNDISQIINKESKKPIMKDKTLVAQKIDEKTKLVFQLKDPGLQLKRIKAKQFNSFMIIYKQRQKEPKKFKYSQISQLTFSEIYNTYLELEESKQRKDLKYALIITDLIIKPNQKINLAEIYFKNTNKEPLNVVAKVINQKMIFFHTIPPLVQKEQDFVLDKLIIIPYNQQEKRKNVRQLSKKKAQKTKNQYFKKQQRLEPILIYTSQLKYFDTKDKKPYKIYESLNRFLRETPLLTLEEAQLRNQWRYLYSSTLLKHLDNIEKFQGKTFRGINYDPKAEVGKIITFKQFLSTSISRKTALRFASQNSNPIKHMFELEIFQGYPIKQYSEFLNQQEILLEPFTDFKVIDINQNKEEVNGKTYTFKIYCLKQLATEKKLPVLRANFVVWIDDKTLEGQQIFSKFDMPTQTTILIQKLSTSDLGEWLESNQQLFSDPTANLVFITNMSRVENGKFNGIAGIEGLNLIRKYDLNIPVFFYIGDLKKAHQKFIENKVDIKNIKIGNQTIQIIKFISESITSKK